MTLREWWRAVAPYFGPAHVGKPALPPAAEVISDGWHAQAARGGVTYEELTSEWRSIQPQPDLNSTPTPPAAPATAVPATPSPQETSMSWFSKYIVDPIRNSVAASPETGVIASTATQAMTTATQAVDPIFNEAEQGVQAVVDSALARAGIVGAVTTPAANMFLAMLGAALHSALDAKLGVAQPAQQGS